MKLTIRYTAFFICLIFTRPAIWVVLTSYVLISGIFFNGLYFSHIAQQGQAVLPTVTDSILIPFSSLTAFLLAVITPLFGTLYFHHQRDNLQVFLFNFPISDRKILFCKALALLLTLSLLLICSLGMILSLHVNADVNNNAIFSTFLGLLLVVISLVACSMVAAQCSQNKTDAASAAIALVFVLAFIEVLAGQEIAIVSPLAQSLSLFSDFKIFQTGTLALNAVTFYFSISALLFSLAYYTRRQSEGWTTRRILTTIGLITLLIASKQWQADIHLKQDAAHKLPEETKKLLNKLDQPMHITVYSHAPDIQQSIKGHLRPLLRYSKKIRLHFESAQLKPPAEQRYAMSTIIRLTYEDQTQYLQYPFEQSAIHSLTLSIKKLLHTSPIVLFIEGHGERSPFGQQNRDLRQLHELLLEEGFHVLASEVSEHFTVADNTDLLVIASPQTPYSAVTVNKIIHYIEQGGSLLWLREPDTNTALERLESVVQVARLPGTLIDPDGFKRGTPHPAITLVDHFEYHESTQQLTELGAFPFTSALTKTSLDAPARAIIRSKTDTWLDRSENLQLGLNSLHNPDSARQHTIAYAVEGRHPGRHIIVGGGHFLSDAAIHNYGNRALTKSLFGWLARMDRPLADNNADPVGSNIAPHRIMNTIVVYVYPWLLPFVILLTGLVLYYRRYHHAT